MKKIISVILIIIFTFSLFVGCDNNQNGELSKNIKDIGIADGSVKDDKSDNEAANKTDETDNTDKNNPQGTIIKNIVSEKDAFKEPISFKYNGKIITLTPHYTDITFTDLYYEKMYKFRDGASRICYSVDLQYITKDGELITTGEYEKNYKTKTDNEFYPEYVFDGEATLPDGTLGAFIGNGAISVMTGEPGAYTKWLYNEDGELLTPTGYDDIGYFNYDGIAAVSQDHKIGFIDEQGNILLEPTIAYDEIRYFPKAKESFYIEYIYENVFILPINNKLVIITIE